MALIVSLEGGKRGRPSGSTVAISVSVSARAEGNEGGGSDVSGASEGRGFVVMSKSSSSGKGIASARSCMSSSGRRCRAVGAGMLRVFWLPRTVRLGWSKLGC
jgi:hypothetical protein